jgi:CYTH domain-containing protein
VSLKSPEDEVRQPTYAKFERERRWLVDPGKRPSLDGAQVIRIEDRYIIGTRMRLRRMDDDTGRTAYKLSRKYEAVDPKARMIVTAYLTGGEYAVFAALPAAVLVKQRYKLARDGLVFNLDLFEGALAGLELTEIEMPDEDSLLALGAPDWAGAEVTDDPAFQGGNLAAR